MKWIDLRSDTVTLPTDEMRQAMTLAEVGDDVYEDDPTVKKLEELAARMVGKAAALFVPSGTFGNQLALFTHCQRGDEVIAGNEFHVVASEVGAASVIAGVQLRTLKTEEGALNPEEVKSAIRDNDIHHPDTGLICIENPIGGRVTPLGKMKEIYEISRDKNIPIHLDGARLFNGTTYLGIEAKEITQYCDSVMFCLSKGLCAPIGSILAGSKEFIAKARKKRKLMGGGLRQVGILAAPGIIALEKMTKRLHEDHSNALKLAKELRSIPGFSVDLNNIHINMVFFDVDVNRYNVEKLVKELYGKGIKVNPPINGKFRFATHYWIRPEDIDYVVKIIKEILKI